MLELRDTTVDVDKQVASLNKTGLNQAACGKPFVSVVIPCFNEERFIGKVLENLIPQYDSERYEIIVVDGMSVDRTREVVAQFAAENSSVPILLVDNPARNIPTGLNIGIERARGDVIVRMDAHAVPSDNYVRRCVEVLSDSQVSVMGMSCRVQPSTNTLIGRAVALAVSHPFGIGDAKYRLPASSGMRLVDTVAFGAFRKSVWKEVGEFNTNLLTNEDYDFNYRVRHRGGSVLLDSSGFCNYFARATVKEIAAQYFRYGRWKAQMVKLHPRSIKLRHLVAPMFVLSVVFMSALSLWWRLALWPLLAIIAAYSGLALICAVQLARRGRDMGLIAVLPVIFFVIHVAWGSSFLLGLISSPPRK